ncbi:MAG: hypothetical protein AABX38_03295 [Candidatus Micrarchaeota archaeon]
MNFIKPRQFLMGSFQFKSYAFAGMHDMPEEIVVYLRRTRKTGICPECKRKRFKL